MEHIMISDAAKEVQVETHVLRYWEEELELPIQRNKQGHRCYTEEDIECFRKIKYMKEQGLQLKAIKTAIEKENTRMIFPKILIQTEKGEVQMAKDEVQTEKRRMQTERMELQSAKAMLTENVREEKTLRLQLLLKQMIAETVREANEELCDAVKQSVLKELDYQFRMQEEREEKREKERSERDEEYYKKMDELLRSKAKRNRSGFFFRKAKQDKPVTESESITATEDEAEETVQG